MHGCEQPLAMTQVVGQAVVVCLDDGIEVREREHGALLVDGEQQRSDLAGPLQERRAHVLLDEEAAGAQPVLRQRHAPIPCGELLEPALFVAVVMRFHRLRRRALADVVNERGKARGDIRRLRGGAVDDQERVLPGITLGVILRRLCLADEQRKLGEGHREDARALERAEEHGRPLCLQGAPQFGDDALLRLMLQFLAAGVHVAARLLRDGEAELCRLARRAQRAHGVFHEVR